MRRHLNLFRLNDYVCADVIQGAGRGKANTFLSELPAVAKFCNGKIQSLVLQYLLLNASLSGHRRFTAFLNSPVKRNAYSCAEAKTPVEGTLLTCPDWLAVGDRAPAIIRYSIWDWVSFIIEGSL
tara:strand:+ start:1023 stop:1397 length:375 start_codon:yes stop_codon:yes gene_type:complete